MSNIDDRACSIEGCVRNRKARGWCGTHYARWERLGDPNAIKYTREVHGMRKSREYASWTQMRYRCNNKSNPSYPYYGGRGIKVCEKWNSSFLEFYKDMGKRPKGTSIERIDNGGDYTPGNCKWGNRTEQAQNRRIRSDNSSGTVGVWWNKVESKWSAAIGVNNGLKRLGNYLKKEDATKARLAAEKKYWVKPKYMGVESE